MQAEFLQFQERNGALNVTASGHWTVGEAARLEASFARLNSRQGTSVIIDLSGVQSLDTAGALLLTQAVRRMSASGAKVDLRNLAEQHEALLKQVAAHEHVPPSPPPSPPLFERILAEIGQASLEFLKQAHDLIAFIGLAVESIAKSIKQPQRIRFTSLVFHIEEVGFNALPIVGLLSFLIGVVMAYQGAEQLRQFGAEIFVVNLIAVSVLRELGVLLTAIVIAGRSGSAFTAQIGSMKIREEIDAMQALGIDPMDALVLPRVFALIISLPILAFFANIMGLFGGGLMSWAVLDISPGVFLERLGQTNYWHYVTGMIKAPVFALVVALVGCHQGLQVSGSAESVGNRTTQSVVQSIFLVILVDAIFSIFFNLMRI